MSSVRCVSIMVLLILKTFLDFIIFVFNSNYVQFKLDQQFSNAIDEVDDTNVQLDWYLFPSKIQRVLPIIIQSTQKAVVIKCFGNVLCARIQFQKVRFVSLLPYILDKTCNFTFSFQVVNTVYSYFMVLRKFYQ